MAWDQIPKRLAADCGLLNMYSFRASLPEIGSGQFIETHFGWYHHAIFRLFPFKPRYHSFQNRPGGLFFGVIAGFLGGAYALPAPPVIIYGVFRQWPPGSLRTTLLGFFLPISLILVASHWAGGLWTSSVLVLYGLSLPVMLVGIFMGNYFNRVISKEKFTKAVYFLLFSCGLLLFVQEYQTLLNP